MVPPHMGKVLGLSRGDAVIFAGRRCVRRAAACLALSRARHVVRGGGRASRGEPRQAGIDGRTASAPRAPVRACVLLRCCCPAGRQARRARAANARYATWEAGARGRTHRGASAPAHAECPPPTIACGCCIAGPRTSACVSRCARLSRATCSAVRWTAKDLTREFLKLRNLSVPRLTFGILGRDGEGSAGCSGRGMRRAVRIHAWKRVGAETQAWQGVLRGARCARARFCPRARMAKSSYFGPRGRG